MDLFEHRDATSQDGAPLADRMRPRSLIEVVGQRELVGNGKILGRAIREDRVPSFILWGPPGTGKTTLARVIANETAHRFSPFSAVLGGVKDLRVLIQAAVEQKRLYQRKTILFVDEIHRFNKSQQDALLPHVERGDVTLIGATTENPSFAVNAALLSRARVFQLSPLPPAELETLLKRAFVDGERGLGRQPEEIEPDALSLIAKQARGDGRRALDVLELASRHAGDSVVSVEMVSEAIASGTLLYDKSGEQHYNVVSAFIKSMRGNDPDAAVYWMMRMLDAGEDPLFVLRRMIIFASEDIGNADPRALSVAIDADAAFRRLGMPEGLFSLAQCCTYLASVPKSNAAYQAFTRAREDIKVHGALPVPLKLRNAPTSAMKDWGYGDGYKYPHDSDGHVQGESYLPEELIGRRYYEPKQAGFEARIRERLLNLAAQEMVEDKAGNEDE